MIAISIILAGLTGMGLILRQSLELLGYEGQLVSAIGLWDDIEAIEVRGETTLGQTFVAPHSGLNRIDVMLFDYGRQNTQPVIFHLRESPEAATDLFAQTFSASDVHGLAWHTFVFPPLPESEGKSYFFYLESPTSSPGDAITFGGSLRNLYAKGSAYLNRQAIPEADLAFRTYYADITAAQKIQMLFARLAAHKPAPWGNPHFYGGLFGVYLITSLVFLLVVFSLIPGKSRL
ncbi:MAG: hypothetical protein Kow0063_38950 [Anaerolineae bacterium]